MSLYDDASLIMYPSGYKESKIYAQKPVNGTGDLTFTRASSATRVNEQGLIETPSIISTTELITNGDFATDTDWSKETGWTISGGNLVGTSVTTGLAYQSSIVEANKMYKATFDAVVTSGSISLYFDGGTGYQGITTTTQTVTVFFTAATTSPLYFRSNTSAFTGSISNVSVKEVITSNVPRIDYSNGCGSLLLEPQRTNLVTYSEDFSNAYWTKSGASVVSGFTSPDGTTNAFKLVEDTSTGVHRLLNSATSLSGDIMISVFAKKGDRNWIKLSNNNIVGAYFNLQSGSVGTVDSGVTASINDYGNGWYRCSILKNRATSGSERLVVDISKDGLGASYIGDGTSGVYIYGAQLEQSSYPTSYIISNSGTSTTRLADAASKTGLSSLIGQTEGVLYAEIAALADDLSFRFITINDGSASNRVAIRYRTASNSISCLISSGGGTVFNETEIVSDITNFNKVAVKYKSGDIAVWINGIEVMTASTAFSISGLSGLSFDDSTGGNKFEGKCQNLMVFPSALTDDELADLTGSKITTFNSLALSRGYTIL